MMDLTRKQILQRLVTMKSYAIGEDYEALEYAINSLKTDEAYQIMYEGGEIFTKDEVVDMLKDLKREMNLGKCQDIIQHKINALKGEENGNLQC